MNTQEFFAKQDQNNMSRANNILQLISNIFLGVKNEDGESANDVIQKQKLNIAVIGAGITGLCSAKNSIEQGHNVTLFEQSEEIGGNWYYTNQTGKDKYGVRIHTGMYDGLRTNTPYHAMTYPDFPYPENSPTYLTQADVLKYLHSYADHFNLKKTLKLSHVVVRVHPIENDKWEVMVKNARANTFETKIYDAVFVCNGHNFMPYTPNFKGIEKFRGKMIHSHEFRKADQFRNKNVLIIGGGTSGRDLVYRFEKVASHVVFSVHKSGDDPEAERALLQSFYKSNVTVKHDVKHFTATGATFFDGSHQEFDIVLFTTGYKFSFPFLTFDAGVTVKNKVVQPLYKKILCVEHPTLAFIGLNAAPVQSFDLQVQFALKFFSGEMKLPSKSEMLKDVEIMKRKKQSIFDTRGSDEKEYIRQLAQIAELGPCYPDVIIDIAIDSYETLMTNPNEFRNYTYTIIDDKTFKKEKNANY